LPDKYEHECTTSSPLSGTAAWAIDKVLNFMVRPLFFYRVDVGRAATQGKVAQQMSWAAHELENFWLLKHQGMRVSYLGLLLGALAPDLLTKVYAYGITITGHT
jgi:hypothetical protein